VKTTREWTIKTYKLLSIIPPGNYVAIYRQLPEASGGEPTVEQEQLDFVGVAEVTERHVSGPITEGTPYDRVTSCDTYSEMVGVVIDADGMQHITNEDDNFCGVARRDADAKLVTAFCNTKYLGDERKKTN
jgi:hypothetical protein